MLGRALVWLATLLGVVVGLLVVLALFGVLHLYSTPSASMEPTLLCARPGPGCTASENDRVAVFKYVGFAPGRGDLSTPVLIGFALLALFGRRRRR